jgi:hypothetical protein
MERRCALHLWSGPGTSRGADACSGYGTRDAQWRLLGTEGVDEAFGAEGPTTRSATPFRPRVDVLGALLLHLPVRPPWLSDRGHELPTRREILEAE